jgi:cold shock CspA family protein
MRGEVVAFDDAKGWGTVRAADGRELFFHCTQIAGGTRTIPVAVEVDFEVRPGRRGRWEAAALTPLSPLTPFSLRSGGGGAAAGRAAGRAAVTGRGCRRWRP